MKDTIAKRKKTLKYLEGLYNKQKHKDINLNQNTYESVVEKMEKLEEEFKNLESGSHSIRIDNAAYEHMILRMKEDKMNKMKPLEKIKAQIKKIDVAFRRAKQQKEVDRKAAEKEETYLIDKYRDREHADQTRVSDIDYAQKTIYFNSLMSKYLDFTKAKLEREGVKEKLKRRKKIIKTKEKIEDRMEEYLDIEQQRRGLEDTLNDIREKTKIISLNKLPKKLDYQNYVKEALQLQLEQLYTKLDKKKTHLEDLKKNLNDIILFNTYDIERCQMRKKLEVKLEEAKNNLKKTVEEARENCDLLNNVENTISRICAQLKIHGFDKVPLRKLPEFLPKLEEIYVKMINTIIASYKEEQLEANKYKEQEYIEEFEDLREESVEMDNPDFLRNMTIQKNESFEEPTFGESNKNPEELTSIKQIPLLQSINDDIQRQNPPQYLGIDNKMYYNRRFREVRVKDKDSNDQRLINKIRSIIKNEKLNKLNIKERNALIRNALSYDESLRPKPLKLSTRLKSTRNTIRNLGKVKIESRERIDRLIKGLVSRKELK